MSNEIKYDKDSFLRLIMSNIEFNSSTSERAKEYLTGEGYKLDDIVKKGLAKITEIQDKLSNEKQKVVNTSNVDERLYLRKGAYWTHPSVKLLMRESGNPDPLNEIKSRARNLVMKGFEMGWNGPPYDPFLLAKYLDIDITPNDQVIDARIVPLTSEKFQIQYNPLQKQTRANFSVSHEIAHTLFSDCAQTIRNREENPSENRQLEQLCNAAAAEIQLPYAMFSHDANNSNPTIEGLLQLATKYKSSLESVFIRYTEVIDKPCAVIIGMFETDEKIVLDYYTSSKSFSIKIPNGFQIPKNSIAYECISPGWTSRETISWEIFKGQSFQAFAVGISPYRKDNKPRVGILILPMNKEENPIEEGKVMLEFGDATKPRGKGIKIIAQVVNTSGALGRGFGYSLSKNYPLVKDKLVEWKANKKEFILGTSNLVKISKDLFVFQMLAQKGLHSNGYDIPLKYNDLRNCLIDLRRTAQEIGASVHMPAIGAGNAKGDWNLIIGMIHDELVNYGIKVNIYLLPGKPFNSNQKSTLTLFKESSTWQTEK